MTMVSKFCILCVLQSTYINLHSQVNHANLPKNVLNTWMPILITRYKYLPT